MRVGELLSEYRSSIGKSLEEVSLSTRIPVDTLALIEANDKDYYENSSLARNFIYTYARLIGADTQKILDAFDSEYMGKKKVKESLGNFTDKKSIWSSKWCLYGLPILVACVIMISVTGYIYDNFEMKIFVNDKSEKELQMSADKEKEMELMQTRILLADSTDYVGTLVMSKDNPMNVDMNP